MGLSGKSPVKAPYDNFSHHTLYGRSLYGTTTLHYGWELAALSLASYRLPNGIAIPLSTTKDALHIMPRITTPYDGIEIIQGSMDDAFIQITGKKLED